MSERRKRKEDTWTKEELSAALHKSEKPRREKSSRSSHEKGSRSEKPKERRSKHHDLEKMLAEHEESMDRKKQRDHPSQHKERSERRRKEITPEEEEAERRARRKREKEKRYEQRAPQDEEPPSRDREKKHRDSERRHREDKHKERRKPEEDPDVLLKERGHREKSERKHRSDDYDAEKERRKREKKEERRRRHEQQEEEERRREKRKHKKEHEASNGDRNREKEATTKSSRSKSKPTDEETYSAPTQENEDGYNYEDEEFEDYEDDFEDGEEKLESENEENNSEMNAIIRAINEENERVASARTASSRSDHKPVTLPSDDDEERDHSSRSSLSSLVTTNVNFSSGSRRKQGGRLHRKILKRHRDLATLIQLDFVSIDCFELSPVTEYNFYIKNFGSQNTRQVTTQCNDDSLDVEVQTEEAETTETWTQHPQDGALASGGTRSDTAGDHAFATPLSMQEDTRSFSNFLQYANELVESAFMEATVWGGSGGDRKSSLSFCDSCTRFNTNISYLQGRKIVLSAFGNGSMALAFSAASQQFSARIDRKCLVTVWKITDAENPHKVLVCDAVPTACCFSASNKNLLFVGTDDGCVLAYDLAEPSTMHHKLLLEKKKTNIFRSPTYTTGWTDDTHSSPIVAVHSLTDDGATNQIYSLEENSRICVWLVAEVVSDVDDDVGLVPHGRVKLVRGMVIDVPTTDISTCVRCPDAKTFYVGTDSGNIISVTRDKRRRTFDSRHLGAVTCLAFNPSSSELMLSGHVDGSLCLFHIGQGARLMSWTVGEEPIVACDWSNCRSSVFVALDSTNQIHVWDLMAIDSAPAVSCKLDDRALSLCIDQCSKKSTSLLVAYESCDFEVHRLSSHFTDSVTSDEAESMTSSILMFA
uniref:WD repeat-containing protein 60-like n=1 Tax=Phallusia mammillata TaxID=59560 RepID=A0A6F9DXM0_9ASCI|nr:WD repeat-containing protein 60-like [Phallusia mammillata]